MKTCVYSGMEAEKGMETLRPVPRILIVMLAVLGLWTLAPAMARAQPVEWTPLQFSARNNHAMAFDAARGVIVLFGGSNSEYGSSNETWEWSETGGGGWSRRFVAGPGARTSHAMAYDAARGVTVLFGGSANNILSGETWEWNGTVWTQRIVSGPSPRSSHAMTYDSARGVTILFGGITSGGTRSGETWEWNGNVWNLRVVGGSIPVPRYGHAMAYDAGRGVTVLFGGIYGPYPGTPLGDTWEWNGSGGGSWTQRAGGGPLTSRYYHAMAYDAARGVTVLFGGGASGGNYGDTWEWHGTIWTRRTQSDSPAPSPRRAHAMVYDAVRGVTVLFGGTIRLISPSGYFDRTIGETWEWDGAGKGVWTQRDVNSTPSPSPRYFHALTYDAARRMTVLFGGYNSNSGFNGETWEWNGMRSESGGGWTQRAVGGPLSPSPRYAHAMAYDATRGVTVLFGGRNGEGHSGETWEWNGTEGGGTGAWTQRFVAGPSPRCWHAMAYDVGRAVTVLFGGSTGTANDETWEWDGNVWTQRFVTGPSPRYGHAMVYDEDRGVTVLFGGYDSNVSNDETWEWNGTGGAGGGAWIRRFVAGPSPRSWHAMAYDGARGVTVLFGGFNGDVRADTWEWNGTGGSGEGIWTRRTGNGPSPRYGHAMAYDAASSATVLFGGFVGLNDVTFSDTTWGLRAAHLAPSITTQPVAQTVCPSGEATFTVIAAGSVPLIYQWQIQLISGDWATLGNNPTPLACPGGGSGFAYASPLPGNPVAIAVHGCPSSGVQHWNIRGIVSNDWGTVTSNNATLTLCSADFNCDGFADSQDFFDFLSAFFALQPAADFNHDSFINSQDFFDFLAAFFAGCN